jgi:putative FmdB family regulatory protein
VRAFDRNARHSTDPRPIPIELTLEDRHHVQEPAPNGTKTGDEVCSSPEEDAETEGAGEEVQEKVTHAQPRMGLGRQRQERGTTRKWTRSEAHGARHRCFPSRRWYPRCERAVLRWGELGGDVMPEYDFECAGCGKKFTKQQTYEEHDRHKRLKCPKCGSQRTRRVIGSVFAKTSKKS